MTHAWASRCLLVLAGLDRHLVGVAAPLVSVILPTRNRSQLLERAVASILAQTEADFEVLVIDNSDAAAGANAGAILSALIDPRVRIVRSTSARNAGSARNVGLELAAGEWITFLDDDDAYRPTKLATQLALARQSNAPLVLCGALVHLHDRTRIRHAGVRNLVGDALLNSAGFATPLILHRRAAGVGFDESLFAGEDFHYLQRLVAHFQLDSIRVVPEPLVDVYQDVRSRERTNLRAEAGWRAARRTWWQFGRRYSIAARRLFVVRAMMTRAKLEGRAGLVTALLPALVCAGGVSELRFGLNALAVGAGWRRGRWVT